MCFRLIMFLISIVYDVYITRISFVEIITHASAIYYAYRRASSTFEPARCHRLPTLIITLDTHERDFIPERYGWTTFPRGKYSRRFSRVACIGIAEEFTRSRGTAVKRSRNDPRRKTIRIRLDVASATARIIVTVPR